MEKFTPLATNFTLPPGLTGWTNFTSVPSLRKLTHMLKIVNTRLTKGFMAIFAPAESLPSPATLPQCFLPSFFKVSGGCLDLEVV